MTEGIRTIIYPVKDLGRAKAVFGALLGAKPFVDEPYYVGYGAGDQHIGLNPNGHANGMAGPVGYWHVANVRTTMDELVRAGAVALQQPTDVGGGRKIAAVKDGDGNVIGLLQTA